MIWFCSEFYIWSSIIFLHKKKCLFKYWNIKSYWKKICAHRYTYIYIYIRISKKNRVIKTAILEYKTNRLAFKFLIDGALYRDGETVRNLQTNIDDSHVFFFTDKRPFVNYYNLCMFIGRLRMVFFFCACSYPWDRTRT